MIEGIQIVPLKVFRDERGQVMRMMRCDDGVFHRFGEVYFSVVNPGVVKGWKKHIRMTQHFAVPKGGIRLVVYDDRPESPTRGEVQKIDAGEDHYVLVCLPPLVWYSFCARGGQSAMIANCTDLPHDPEEVELRAIDDNRIPFSWGGNV